MIIQKAPLFHSTFDAAKHYAEEKKFEYRHLHSSWLKWNLISVKDAGFTSDAFEANACLFLSFFLS